MVVRLVAIDAFRVTHSRLTLGERVIGQPRTKHWGAGKIAFGVVMDGANGDGTDPVLREACA